MQGQIIAGFELQEHLGEGGAGSVWLARQISLERLVAIKILTDQLADNPADIEQFKLEARAAAQLKHTGIVQVYDFGEDNGAYFFAMEYIKGYSVGDWLERKGTLTEKDTLMVGAAIAEALGYAWDKTQLIHRDIKPDNILVDEDGTIKVVDLGLVKVLAADEGETSFESENMCTPNYCSPQQAHGGELDFRTDIYSLGCMMYHMLTGQLPFGDLDPHQVLDQQVDGHLADPRTHKPDISVPTVLLLQKMLAKSAGARPASWEEVMRDISLCMQGQNPTSTLPPDASSTLRYNSSLNPVTSKSASGRIVKIDRQRLHSRESYNRATRPVAAAAAAPGLTPANTPPIKKKSGLPAALISIVVAIVLIGGGLFAIKYTQQVKVQKAIGEHTDRMTEQLNEARTFIKNNPEAWEESTAKLQALLKQSANTPVHALAQTELKKLKNQQRKKVDDVMKDLDRTAGELVRNKNFTAAMNVYKNYSGAFKNETAKVRAKRVADLEPRAIKQDEKQRQDLINASSKPEVDTTDGENEPANPVTNTEDTSPELPPELLPYKQRFEEEITSANEAYLAEFEKIIAGYIDALNRVKDEGQQNGILDIVEATNLEIARVDAEGTLPRRLLDSVPASVKLVMARAAQHRARIEANRNNRLAPVKGSYLLQLRAFQRKLTSDNRINDARIVKEMADNLEITAIPLPTAP